MNRSASLGASEVRRSNACFDRAARSVNICFFKEDDKDQVSVNDGSQESQEGEPTHASNHFISNPTL